MFDLKYLSENLEEIIKKLEKRNKDFSYLYQLPTLLEERKNLLLEADNLKEKRNTISKQIGLYKREGKDTTSLFKDIEEISNQIPLLDEKIKEVEQKLYDIQVKTPNIPDDKVPYGKDETENVVIRYVGEKPNFNFKVKDHIELNESLKIFDFERAAKVTGARFVYDIGLGARLERALINFMMDLHSLNNGYVEVIPPYLVSEATMYATGKFPKFKDEAYKIQGEDWYLNPTAELPMVDMHRNEILDFEKLPLKYCAYTTAFRPEAGAAGKDTRGLIRQHQFHKVELIKFTKPEESEKELEKMLENAELVLKSLGLPYRVVCLCSGDLGESMAITYDIEVWLPGQNKYREIASISNAKDYQARLANIRFKRDKDKKTEYVHTLNGSGLAVGRTAIAILENFQNEDGSVTIPNALIRYMHTDIIK